MYRTFLRYLKQCYLENMEATNTELTTSAKPGLFFLKKQILQPTGLIASIPNHQQSPTAQRQKVEKVR